MGAHLSNAHRRKASGRGVLLYKKEIIKEEKMVIVKTPGITVIAMYMNPEATAEKVVENILSAVEHTEQDERVILAGDFNCRIDKTNVKTELVVEALQEEGFTLINKPQLITYIAPNGTSAIDLVLFKRNGI